MSLKSVIVAVSLVGIVSCIVVTPSSETEDGFSNKADYHQVSTYGHPSYSLPSSLGEDYGGYLSHYYGHHHPQHIQPSHHQPVQVHHHQGDPLKHLLLPLAGVALLGAAAIFAANPVLIQLGVLSGRRRKRSANFSDIAALEEFIAKVTDLFD